MLILTGATIWGLTQLNSFLLLNAVVADAQESAQPAAPATCSKQGHDLINKSYNTHRWYTKAQRDPATEGEQQRINALPACADAVDQAKHHYWAYYRHHIAIYTGGGRRWSIVYGQVVCESQAGAASSNLYGLLDAWYEHWLPVKGNNTGTRFAGSAGSATKLEQDVMAAVSREHHAYWESCG